MFEQAIEAVFEKERLHVIAEELRLLLRRRDQLSIHAARLARELARLGYGEVVGSISTPD
jgi:hypothetical protein